MFILCLVMHASSAYVLRQLLAVLRQLLATLSERNNLNNTTSLRHVRSQCAQLFAEQAWC